MYRLERVGLVGRGGLVALETLDGVAMGRGWCGFVWRGEVIGAHALGD